MVLIFVLVLFGMMAFYACFFDDLIEIIIGYYKSAMGLTNKTINKAQEVGFRSFDKQDWNISKQQSLKFQQMNGIHQNHKSSYNQTKIDEYLLYLSEETQTQDYFQVFRWRNRSDLIVQGLYVNSCVEDNIFCSDTKSFSVFLESIPIRLSQVTDFIFPQNLYVLFCCLKGFQYIYRFIKNFTVKESMIGFTKEGRVKLWINQNYSKNYPNTHTYRLNYSEIGIVKEIIRIVCNNVDHSYQPLDFEMYLQHHQIFNPTFQQAIYALYQYTHQFRAVMPFRCQSVSKFISFKNNMITRQQIKDNQPFFQEQNQLKKNCIQPMKKTNHKKRSVSNAKRVNESPKNSHFSLQKIPHTNRIHNLQIQNRFNNY